MAKNVSRWLALFVLLGLAASVMAADCEKGWRERWDPGEADILRTTVLPTLTALPDFAQIKDVFDKALANDPTAAAALMDLVGHANEDVAASAAAALGRFPSPAAASRLKQAFNTETRVDVRSSALGGLVRMGDPEAGALAARALSDPNLEMQVAGAFDLRRLRDSRYGAPLLAYYRQHPDEWSLLEWVGCLGDAPGSTTVRDGLMAEANNKSYDFKHRLAAAAGLEEMGFGQLVKGLLDRDKGDETHQRLGAIVGAIRRLAFKRGVTLKSQADVDTLLRDAAISKRLDMWHRPIRVNFVREGEIRATSDGPDGVPDTPDDLSTAEPYQAWVYRLFRDQFP
jgi:hypothetical protein